MGTIYLVACAVLDVVFLREAYRAAARIRAGGEAAAMRLFHWSITYLRLLFGAMALDQLV